MPEIQDISHELKTIQEIGTFSESDFTVIGLGSPREIHAGVVDGNYFDVMGLRPVARPPARPRRRWPERSRRRRAHLSLLAQRDCTPIPTSLAKPFASKAAAAPASATIVGVLEPSVPYPVETEIIANIVTSPHHLSATMVTGREHRMTEVFARLTPGATSTPPAPNSAPSTPP